MCFRILAVAATILFWNLFSATSTANTLAQPNLSSGIQPQTSVEWRQYDVGRQLYLSLLRNYSAFIGTVTKIDHGESSEQVTVTIDEWLWGDTSRRKSNIRLVRPHQSERSNLGSNGSSPWAGVKVQINRRLLVVSDLDTSSDGQGDIATPNNALIISDEALFQSLRDALNFHSMLEKNSEEIVRAPDLLTKANDSILAGYVVSYLWRGTRPNSVNTEALVLSKLLASNAVPTVAWLNIRMALTQLMLNRMAPPSEQAFASVVNDLVTMGSGDDEERATQAVKILVDISDKKALKLASFLNEQKRTRLRKIYFSNFTGSGHRNHPAFESQLQIMAH
jgi:hypothetical protein